MNKTIRWNEYLICTLITWVLLLTSCNGTGSLLNPASQPTATFSPIATTVPQKTLVICVGQEPDSLYLYGESTRAKWSVLEALYDGPIDTVGYLPQPVILEEIPSQENGGVKLGVVAVSEGEPVANTEGNVVALKKGVKVFSEGCTSPECAVEWDGSTPINLTQMSATFTLLEGVKWSDGNPLVAGDSVFSYTVSADPATEVNKVNINRTLIYKATDYRTIEWTGIPGYLTLNPSAFFWIPLPEHELGSLAPEEMYVAEESTLTPLGWGPYQVDEWVAGDRIRMVKNPNYFRADEGLPKFDVLIYRFLPDYPEADISRILTGECDIMDTSLGLENQIRNIRELEFGKAVKGYYGTGPEWEALNFGIKPNSYDAVYNPYLDRQDFFGDLRTRQAAAYCLDRAEINKQVLFSLSGVPLSYLTPDHPYAATDLPAYDRDVELGKKLLDEVGWVDADGDPLTPRVSNGIPNVVNGTELNVTLNLTESDKREYVLEILLPSLAECGIKVNVEYLDVTSMYATGESGRVFGRNFDLAELAWSTGRQPPCFLYITSEIPSADNNWLGEKYGGVNFTGYSNADYDAACADLLSVGLNRELLVTQSIRTQQLLAEEIPVIPLYYHLKTMLSRPDLCGLELDVTSRSGLRLLENLDLSETCP